MENKNTPDSSGRYSILGEKSSKDSLEESRVRLEENFQAEHSATSAIDTSNWLKVEGKCQNITEKNSYIYFKFYLKIAWL